MNKHKKITILTISVLISIPLMFISLRTEYSRIEYPPCPDNSLCPEDIPTGQKTLGWPLPACTKKAGDMPSLYDNLGCSIFSTNAIADSFIIFVPTFATVTCATLIVDKLKTKKLQTKKH